MAEVIEDPEREVHSLFRQVFGTTEGKRVLGMILLDLGFLEEAHDSDRVALRNYATQLIRKRIGMNNAHGMMEIINDIIEYAG